MHRVLLVEDEEAVARALERWLRRRRAEVHVLLDATALEAALGRFAPSLVVSDLQMPKRDGLEVLEVVKAQRPEAIRALLSGSLESLDPRRLSPIQPVRLIHKPWREETLADELGLTLDPAPPKGSRR